SRRRHTRSKRDWSSDVCSSDLYEHYGLSLWDMDREFYCGGLGGHEKAPLRDIVKILRETYCGKVGSEYMHLLDLEEREWLQSRQIGRASWRERVWMSGGARG